MKEKFESEDVLLILKVIEKESPSLSSSSR